MSLRATTWQTVGPFFRIGMEPLYTWDIAGDAAHGQRIYIEGRVIDGAGLPVPDAILEIWQANAAGKYNHREDTQDKPLDPSFRGFGRIPSDEQGRFRFTTIKPGAVPGPDQMEQSPHLVVSVFMRGLLRGLVTRAYFPNEHQLANDPILNLVDIGRRKTLIMKASLEEAGPFHWDIRLQGQDETVFFDF